MVGVMKSVSILYKNRSGRWDGARGDGNAEGPPTHLDLEMLRRLMLPAVSLLLLACIPAEAWYKQVAGPRYYSVGRASGLLSGIRRSPYTKRAEPEPTDGESAGSNAAEASLQNFILRTMVSALQRNYGMALIATTSCMIHTICAVRQRSMLMFCCSPTSPSVSKTSKPTLRAASSCRTSGACSAVKPTSSSPWTPQTVQRTEPNGPARTTSSSKLVLKLGGLKLSYWF